MSSSNPPVLNRLLTGIIERPYRILLPFILFLTILGYINTLYSPLTLDDTHTFVRDSSVYLHDFSLSSLKQLANSKFGIKRFLPMLSFAINHKLFKGDIPYYHITNILIHLLVTIALFFFTLRLFETCDIRRSSLKPATLAFIVTGLWALNPVQTNAVTYLVQRMTSMACMFYVGSLCFYVYGRTTEAISKKILFLSASGLCAIASFFSKENSATLPIALVMTETFFISPGIISRFLAKFKLRQWLSIALVAILLSPPVIAFIQPLTSYSQRSFTMLERLLTESRVVVWYISLVFLPLPSRMTLEHDFSISHGFLEPSTTILAILLIILLLWLAIRIRKETPLVSYGILWFFLNLVIESTIIPLEIAFEHRLYLPSIGLFLALAGILDYYMARREVTKEREGAVILLVICLLCISSILTTLRNNDWRSELSIYRDCARKAPHKARAISELGLAMADKGLYQDAIKYSKEAIRLGKPYREVYCSAATNLVLSLAHLGKRKEAVEETSKYLEEIPAWADQGSLWTLLYNQALLYWEDHQFVKAYYTAKKSLLIQFSNSNQASVMLAMQILTDAFDNPAAKKTLNLTGNIQRKAVLVQMSELMTQARDYEKAEIYLNLAEKEYPDSPEIETVRKIITDITNKNHQSQTSSIVSNQKAYSHLDYKLAWLGINFIMKYYKPLTPLAGKILETTIRRYPNDPFLTTKYLRYRLDYGTQAFDIKQLEEALAAHPDFIPLIKLAIDVYSAKNDRANADKMITRLLKLYPGVASWRTYLLAIGRSTAS